VQDLLDAADVNGKIQKGCSDAERTRSSTRASASPPVGSSTPFPLLQRESLLQRL
jgi:hypothetical protein